MSEIALPEHPPPLLILAGAACDQHARVQNLLESLALQVLGQDEVSVSERLACSVEHALQTPCRHFATVSHSGLYSLAGLGHHLDAQLPSARVTPWVLPRRWYLREIEEHVAFVTP